MAGLSSNAVSTYGVSTIREDLQDAYSMISSTEFPFQASIGSKDAKNTYVEWPVVELAAASTSNRVLEGENAPANDAATLALRMGNYLQISDKVAEVTFTSERIEGAAGNIQKMSKQVSLKLKELKRDIESMITLNVAANAGAAATARVSAGMLAHMISNTSRGAGAGANPILSGTTSGYISTAAVAGTARAATEALLKTIIAECWAEGANPSIVLVNAAGKQVISEDFTGVATRYKDAEDKKVVAAIDVYVSDFGELQIVPSRFFSSTDMLIYDPDYVRMLWLDPVKQKELARTGHAERRLIWGEYGLQVDNEKAHGVVADINWAL